MQFIIQIITNIAGLLAITYLLPGIEFSGSWFYLLTAGLIWGIINMWIKPLLEAIWPAFIYITLAIFTILINISLLISLALWVPGISTSGFWPIFWGVAIMSLINYSITTIMHYK